MPVDFCFSLTKRSMVFMSEEEHFRGNKTGLHSGKQVLDELSHCLAIK